LDAKVEMILRYQPETVVVAVVNQANAAYLSESVAYLFGRGFRFIVSALDYPGGWTVADLKLLKREYKKVAEFYIEQHRAGRELYFNVFDEKIKTHALGPNRRGQVCDLGRETISVAPNGDIFPCVQFVSPEGGAYRIGSVLTGFDEEKRQALIRENLAEREQCTGCALEGRCNNWCGCLNWKATGSIRRVPPILCEHERMVTPIADRIGKVLYRERNEMFMRKHYREGVPGPH
jgi:uncharacterized protein